MIDKIRQLMKQNREVISYLFWGVCTTLVSWISYSLLAKGLDLSVAAANAISWVLAVLFAFFVNKIFVFQSKNWQGMQFIKELSMFLSARIFSGVFEIVMVPLLVKIGLNQPIFGVKGALSKVLVNVGVMVLNYFFSKFLIFRKK